MNNPYPFMVIVGAVGFAIVIMLWVFSAPNNDVAANRAPGSAIPPSTSSEPAQQGQIVGSGGATSDSTRGASGPTTKTDRIR